MAMAQARITGVGIGNGNGKKGHNHHHQSPPTPTPSSLRLAWGDNKVSFFEMGTKNSKMGLVDRAANDNLKAGKQQGLFLSNFINFFCTLGLILSWFPVFFALSPSVFFVSYVLSVSSLFTPPFSPFGSALLCHVFCRLLVAMAFF
jgi:hypothetical protein